MAGPDDPFAGPLPREVPLPHAPLERVIAQVRFPTVLSLGKQDFVAPFQEAIRKVYPVLRSEQTRGVTVSPHLIVAAGPEDIAWRFQDVEVPPQWRVSVTRNFIAIETTSYTSRNDFLSRLRFVLEAFAEHVDPALVQRLGIRYIDRVTGDALTDIDRLVRPQALGIVASPLHAHTQHSLTETVFALPDSRERLLARWGLVPPGGTVDPNAIEPINQPSWVLDIDMFSDEERPFVPEQIVSATRQYAERLYAVFRWAVTEEFLRRYGGTP